MCACVRVRAFVRVSVRVRARVFSCVPDVCAQRPAAECAICFESMHAAPSGVFADAAGRRTCAHFFHRACAEAVRDRW